MRVTISYRRETPTTISWEGMGAGNFGFLAFWSRGFTMSCRKSVRLSPTLWLRTLNLSCSYTSTEESFLPFAKSFRSLPHSVDLHLPLNWGTFSAAWWSYAPGSPIWSASVNILSVSFIPSKCTALSLLRVRSCKAISFQLL